MWTNFQDGVYGQMMCSIYRETELSEQERDFVFVTLGVHFEDRRISVHSLRKGL